jgi:hypothetical protein
LPDCEPFEIQHFKVIAAALGHQLVIHSLRLHLHVDARSGLILKQDVIANTSALADAVGGRLFGFKQVNFGNFDPEDLLYERLCQALMAKDELEDEIGGDGQTLSGVTRSSGSQPDYRLRRRGGKTYAEHKAANFCRLRQGGKPCGKPLKHGLRL